MAKAGADDGFGDSRYFCLLGWLFLPAPSRSTFAPAPAEAADQAPNYRREDGAQPLRRWNRSRLSSSRRVPLNGSSTSTPAAPTTGNTIVCVCVCSAPPGLPGPASPSPKGFVPNTLPSCPKKAWLALSTCRDRPRRLSPPSSRRSLVRRFGVFRERERSGEQMPGSRSTPLKIKYLDSTTKCHSLPRAAFFLCRQWRRKDGEGGKERQRHGDPPSVGGLVLMGPIPESEPFEVLF